LILDQYEPLVSDPPFHPVLTLLAARSGPRLCRGQRSLSDRISFFGRLSIRLPSSGRTPSELRLPFPLCMKSCFSSSSSGNLSRPRIEKACSKTRGSIRLFFKLLQEISMPPVIFSVFFLRESWPRDKADDGQRSAGTDQKTELSESTKLWSKRSSVSTFPQFVTAKGLIKDTLRRPFPRANPSERLEQRVRILCFCLRFYATFNPRAITLLTFRFGF